MDPIKLDKDDVKSLSRWSSVLLIASSGVLGSAIGVVTHKCGVFEPSVIHGHLSFNSLLLAKFFLTAIATNMFVWSILSMVPSTYETFKKTQHSFRLHLLNKGVTTSVVGGGAIGVGVATSHVFPDLELVRVGAGSWTIGFTILGCLWGGLVYGLLEPYLNILKPRQPFLRFFYHEIQRTPYFMLCLPVASVLSVVVFALELYSPWIQDFQSVSVEPSSHCWSLYMSGVAVGVLYIPLTLTHDLFGAAGGYCAVVLQIASKSVRRSFPFLSQFRSGKHTWNGVVFLAGLFAGSYVSSSASSHTQVHPAAMFIGGFLVGFGSLLSGVCFSFHCVSGAGLMSLHSIMCTLAACSVGMAWNQVWHNGSIT